MTGKRVKDEITCDARKSFPDNTLSAWKSRIHKRGKREFEHRNNRACIKFNSVKELKIRMTKMPLERNSSDDKRWI